MTNGLNNNASSASAMDDQVSEDSAVSQDTDNCATPEDLVRDLLDSEAEGESVRSVSYTDAAYRAVLSYRPTPRNTAVILLVIIAVTMPWLIPALISIGLTFLLLSYVSLGPERSERLFIDGYGWLEGYDPQGAEELRSNAARVSAGLTVWLEGLPERWTRGLYLPDFERADEMSVTLTSDPFTRLNVEA